MRLSLQTSRVARPGRGGKKKNAENESKSSVDVPWNNSNGRCMEKLYNNCDMDKKLWRYHQGDCHGEIYLGIRALGIEVFKPLHVLT